MSWNFGGSQTSVACVQTCGIGSTTLRPMLKKFDIMTDWFLLSELVDLFFHLFLLMLLLIGHHTMTLSRSFGAPSRTRRSHGLWCRITLQVFIDNFDEELGTLLRLERAHVCAIIGRLRSFASWPFLEPDHVPTRHPDDEDLHPAEPHDEPDLPSIWRLDIVKILLQLPGVDRLRFPEGVVGHQCQTNRPFGSQSAYPGSESLHCTGGSNIVPASCLRYVRTGNSRCCSLTSCC